MNQHLRDSLRFMFQDSKCNYTSLLKAASTEEIECERGQSLGLHSKRGTVVEMETNRPKNRNPSPVISSVASIESNIDQLTMIVKSAQKIRKPEK